MKRCCTECVCTREHNYLCIVEPHPVSYRARAGGWVGEWVCVHARERASELIKPCHGWWIAAMSSSGAAVRRMLLMSHRQWHIEHQPISAYHYVSHARVLRHSMTKKKIAWAWVVQHGLTCRRCRVGDPVSSSRQADGRLACIALAPVHPCAPTGRQRMSGGIIIIISARPEGNV